MLMFERSPAMPYTRLFYFHLFQIKWLEDTKYFYCCPPRTSSFYCLSSSVSYISKYVCDHHKFIHKLIQLLPAIQKIKWRLFNIERGEHGLRWKKVFQTIEKKLPSLAEAQISLRRVQTGSPPREGIEVFVAIPRAKKHWLRWRPTGLNPCQRNKFSH